MIHEIWSEDSRFKRMTFQPGLNVVLAERAHADSSKETANSCGKSSLIELIYFLFGGSPSQGSPLKHKRLKGKTYHMRYDAGSLTVTAKRILGRTKTSVGGFPEPGKARSLNADEWKKALGEIWWAIPEDGFDISPDEPTAGRLLKYVARIQKAGGFDKPEKGWRVEREAQSGANVAYLLGLPWKAASAWGTVAEQEKTLRELRKAGGARFFQRMFGSVEEMQGECEDLDDQIAKRRRLLASKDLAQIRNTVVEKVDDLRREVSKAANELFENRRALRTIERALKEEATDGQARRVIQSLPSELESLVIRKLDEIELFQKQVMSNRRVYLEEERQRLHAPQQALASKHAELAERLRVEMASVSDTSVWNEFENHATVIAELAGRRDTLQSRIDAIKNVENERKAISKYKKELKNALDDQLKGAEARTQGLREEFQSIVQHAYGGRNLQADLAFEAGLERLAVKAEIESGAGEGIGNVQIWALDTLVKHMERKLGFSCGVLAHDSHVFDPIDSEQVPTLLKVAGERAAKEGWQYIVTLNRSDLDLDGRDAWLLPYVNPVRLTDADDGGLFGFRFGEIG